MANLIKIKKGLDIPLEGIPSGEIRVDRSTSLFAVCPDDFPGISWKAAVKEGDTVKTGTPLLIDKSGSGAALTAPVAGTVKEIHRGERRRILFVAVEKTENQDTVTFDTSVEPDRIKDTLLRSGLWSMMRQRPFDIVPDPAIAPRDIFITAFDSAPLAPELIDKENRDYLESGINILKKLTEGEIFLGVRKGSNITSRIAKVYEFDGPHPAGNIGVQIAAVKPVNKGETVWAVDAQTVCRIGRLFTKNILDWSIVVAVTGPLAKNPCRIQTFAGAALKTLLEGNITDPGDVRVISGNVLTGVREDVSKGFLRYPYRQITLIREGATADEFMGWASMDPRKFSVKRTFPAFLRGLAKPFPFDARLKGGHRAMILSGEYDKVFPFDIYPEYLIKAILAGDIDRMEKLGIYEVAPEDFALPEFVDTSKNELQKIVRDGLDNLRKEL